MSVSVLCCAWLSAVLLRLCYDVVFVLLSNYVYVYDVPTSFFVVFASVLLYNSIGALVVSVAVGFSVFLYLESSLESYVNLPCGESIPPLADVITRLIRVTDISQTPNALEENVALVTETKSSIAASNSIDVAHTQKENRGSKGGKGRGNPPICTYCKRRDHNRDKCYSLHGFPLKFANVARTQVSIDTNGSPAPYEETPTGQSSSV
ncbi:hypothetical protein CRG98_032812, partial [Punica granatum]